MGNHGGVAVEGRLYLFSWNVACVLAVPDLGKDHCWSILCTQGFTSSGDGRHQVFATPPCSGQRRRFLQKMYCEQVLPGQNMYAKDLEDLSILVTTRLKDARVHICVDAQTDGTFLSASSWSTRWLPRTPSATVTPAIPTSTRATTMAATNRSRLTTSCHPTTVCDPKHSTHRLLHRRGETQCARS